MKTHEHDKKKKNEIKKRVIVDVENVSEKQFNNIFDNSEKIDNLILVFLNDDKINDNNVMLEKNEAVLSKNHD